MPRPYSADLRARTGRLRAPRGEPGRDRPAFRGGRVDAARLAQAGARGGPARRQARQGRAATARRRRGAGGARARAGGAGRRHARGARRRAGRAHRPAVERFSAVPGARAPGLAAQKKTLRAAEQDRADVAEERAAWREEVAAGRLDPASLVFVDESGIDARMTPGASPEPSAASGPGARCRSAAGVVPPWSARSGSAGWSRR